MFYAFCALFNNPLQKPTAAYSQYKQNKLIIGFRFSHKIIANEQAERRRSACEAASVMPREVLVVSWCCRSPNDVTFSLFCVSHYHKVQVFIQPLQILISANECKTSVGLAVPINSLTNFNLIKGTVTRFCACAAT